MYGIASVLLERGNEVSDSSAIVWCVVATRTAVHSECAPKNPVFIEGVTVSSLVTLVPSRTVVSLNSVPSHFFPQVSYQPIHYLLGR
jgi:hypothetical protein